MIDELENTRGISKNYIPKNSVIGLCLIFSRNMRWGALRMGRLQMRTNILDWKHERRVQLKDNRTDGTTVKWSWNKFGVSITLELLRSDRCPVEVCCRHSNVQYHAQNLLTSWGTINYRRPPRHDIIVRQEKHNPSGKSCFTDFWILRTWSSPKCSMTMHVC